RPGGHGPGEAGGAERQRAGEPVGELVGALRERPDQRPELGLARRIRVVGEPPLRASAQLLDLHRWSPPIVGHTGIAPNERAEPAERGHLNFSHLTSVTAALGTHYRRSGPAERGHPTRAPGAVTRRRATANRRRMATAKAQPDSTKWN